MLVAASVLMQHVAMCFCCSLNVYTVTIGQKSPGLQERDLLSSLFSGQNINSINKSILHNIVTKGKETRM